MNDATRVGAELADGGKDPTAVTVASKPDS